MTEGIVAPPFRCTSATPWHAGITATRVLHDDVVEVGEQEDGWPAGDFVTMKCRICGHQWKVELPQ